MSNERIARLEEQMRTTIHRQNETDGLLTKAATDITALSTLGAQHSDTIQILSRCVFGAIALVLFAVGGALVASVVKQPEQQVLSGQVLYQQFKAAAAAEALRSAKVPPEK